MISDKEYQYSTAATKPLVKLIMEQRLTFDPKHSIHEQLKSAKSSVRTTKQFELSLQQKSFSNSPDFAFILKHQSTKGTSLWLTTLPIANLGFVMNKMEFH